VLVVEEFPLNRSVPLAKRIPEKIRKLTAIITTINVFMSVPPLEIYYGKDYQKILRILCGLYEKIMKIFNWETFNKERLKGKRCDGWLRKAENDFCPPIPLMRDERAKVILEETAPLFNQRKNRWFGITILCRRLFRWS
jgi:hypothetical protein